jgi:hypothetical protein
MRHRNFVLVLVALVAALAAALGGCATGTPPPTTFQLQPDGGGEVDGTAGGADSGAGPDVGTVFSNDSGGTATGTLVIQPANPTVAVTITDGQVTVTPVNFVATSGGSTVNATWQLDRGDLGPIGSATGVFTASGLGAGVGNITATLGGAKGQTTVTVTIVASQNGGVSNPNAPSGGVGGTGSGGKVNSGTQGSLTGTATPPASATQLGWLYPYDGTVWPHGILPPLMQWQSTLSISAIYVHATEKNYEFKGFYSGPQIVNQPFDGQAWQTAINSNTGDPLKVEITVTDGKSVVGPITENWTIAPGVLQGTVYYDSYNTQLAPPITSEGQTNSAAVMAIRPGAPQPTLALGNLAQTQCVVCHVLSADGSTMFSQMNAVGDNYADGTSYNLLNGGAPIMSYTLGQPAPDGTLNNRKFAWSAVYPDGTFAMAGAGYAREAYTTGPSKAFARSNGDAVATSGWDSNNVFASMPSFSSDGRSLVFNFWSGSALNGVNPGNGKTLAVVDFNCGAQSGSTTCSSPPYSVSNARQIFQESSSTRLPGWPAFVPGNQFVVFHDSVAWNHAGDDPAGGCTATPTPASDYNCMFATWKGAQAELWIVDVPKAAGTTSPVALAKLNGAGYLPTNASHPNDAVLNYEPTLNPIATGGYNWVVFTSRRMYGNVATGNPYDVGTGTSPVTKKLWVAAIDLNPTPGKDPSHPAFYLPGQELNAGNMRGHWVVNPCLQNGQSCTAGDQCCGGYCEQGPNGGGLVCGSQSTGCSSQYDKCTTTSDCCLAVSGYTCVGGYCVAPNNN